MPWDPLAPKVGEQAADLDLLDEAGRPVVLSSLARGPLVALVFRGPADPESLKLLREYRDATLSLRMAGVSVCAIGHADPSALSYMRMERGLGFPVLADADGTALSRWGMLDCNGLFLLDRGLVVRQRALDGRAPADAMLTFVRRGGMRRRPRLGERVAHALHALAHALRPRRFAR